jgi:hypothetical protein
VFGQRRSVHGVWPVVFGAPRRFPLRPFVMPATGSHAFSCEIRGVGGTPCAHHDELKPMPTGQCFGRLA